MNLDVYLESGELGIRGCSEMRGRLSALITEDFSTTISCLLT